LQIFGLLPIFIEVR